MTPSDGSNVPPTKRRKLDSAAIGEAEGSSRTSTSLSRPVSPPTVRRKAPSTATASLLVSAPTWGVDDVSQQTVTPPPLQQPPPGKQANQSSASSRDTLEQEKSDGAAGSDREYVASPFQLTKIRDLAPHQNVDTIELKDVLGDPAIRECWNFNFLFDLDFVMQQFNEGVRDLVKVKIVHGFWKRDDERRIHLMETAERYSNMELINAYLPDPFGTHHSKMLVLFRHDGCAQVIIHTANMISKDWGNMTQAIWRSPLLPLQSVTGVPVGPHAIGSGNRFQVDLLRYLGSYGNRLRRLSDELALYDFSAIRAAFLGSAPSRQVVNSASPAQQTSFGWLGLQEILSKVPSRSRKDRKMPPHIILQVSSIATLGATPTWLSHFQSVLARSHTLQQFPPPAKPKYNIIFPTPDEIRLSLDGYASGGSIYMKLQSPQQQKQLQYLHPLLCHWTQHSPQFSTHTIHSAHRGPAAPHIKTYLRFSSAAHTTLDWALLTSANLSKQAWGAAATETGEVRIQSYEAGVLVWPGLFGAVEMVPVFGRDTPMGGEEGERDANRISKHSSQNNIHKRIIVGLRMPYDLPLSPYSATDKPWCASQAYTERDTKDRVWGGW
ncbi:phospholipase D/nuclease [Lizonia empirigonia]|nr:phospholipase D/nuclease [Lizonia empirigonia]